MADYCTLAELKVQIPESIYATVTTYDASISAMITAASRLIDRELGRWDNFFYPSGSATVRYYDGTTGDTVYIDEFVSVSAVAVSENGSVVSGDYTALSSTDYFAEPANASGNAKPYNRLVMDFINGSGQSWYEYRKSVKVTAVFGWSTTPPADVNMACKIQAVRWLMRSKQMYQDVGVDGAIGGMVFKGQTGLDNDIKALLYGYKMELIR